MIQSYHDYESFGYLDFSLSRAEELTEAFSGTKIVGWHGRVETQLVNLLNDAIKGRNHTYADKLREFLKIWRANEITGSINRETIEILKSATDILAVDEWKMANYFRSLRDQLKILIASEEQLPRGMEEPGNDPMAGGGGGHGGPPMSPDFGPEKGAPGGGGPDSDDDGSMASGLEGSMPPQSGEPGDESPTGEDVGAPGAEPGAPEPGANEEGVNPEDMPDEQLGLA